MLSLEPFFQIFIEYLQIIYKKKLYAKIFVLLCIICKSFPKLFNVFVWFSLLSNILSTLFLSK